MAMNDAYRVGSAVPVLRFATPTGPAVTGLASINADEATTPSYQIPSYRQALNTFVYPGFGYLPGQGPPPPVGGAPSVPTTTPTTTPTGAPPTTQPPVTPTAQIDPTVINNGGGGGEFGPTTGVPTGGPVGGGGLFGTTTGPAPGRGNLGSVVAGQVSGDNQPSFGDRVVQSIMDNFTTGRGIGRNVGALAGGVLGAVAGPPGSFLGAVLGGALGGQLGGTLDPTQNPVDQSGFTTTDTPAGPGDGGQGPGGGSAPEAGPSGGPAGGSQAGGAQAGAGQAGAAQEAAAEQPGAPTGGPGPGSGQGASSSNAGGGGRGGQSAPAAGPPPEVVGMPDMGLPSNPTDLPVGVPDFGLPAAPAPAVDPQAPVDLNTPMSALPSYDTVNVAYAAVDPVETDPEAEVEGGDDGAPEAGADPGDAAPSGSGMGESVANGSSVGDFGNYMGGPITADSLQGPNPPGPDDGYASLDQGEFVIPAAQASQHSDILRAIQSGTFNPQSLQQGQSGMMTSTPTIGMAEGFPPDEDMDPYADAGEYGGQAPMSQSQMAAHRGFRINEYVPDTPGEMDPFDDGYQADEEMNPRGSPMMPPNDGMGVNPADAMQRAQMLQPQARMALASTLMNPEAGGALLQVLGPAFAPLVQTLATPDPAMGGMGAPPMHPGMGGSPMTPMGGGLGAMPMQPPRSAGIGSIVA